MHSELGEAQSEPQTSRTSRDPRASFGEPLANSRGGLPSGEPARGFMGQVRRQSPTSVVHSCLVIGGGKPQTSGASNKSVRHFLFVMFFRAHAFWASERLLWAPGPSRNDRERKSGSGEVVERARVFVGSSNFTCMEHFKTLPTWIFRSHDSDFTSQKHREVV